MELHYFKITYSDIDIAKDYFQNDNHFGQFLAGLVDYYRTQNVPRFKSKCVTNYFKTYQKSADFILKQITNGKKGGVKSADNKAVTKTSLQAPLKATLKPKVKINKDKLNINKDNLKKENTKENFYRSFAHLSISEEDNNQFLITGYSQKQIDAVYDAIENYKKNSNYKSLYLTAKKWLQKEKPNRDSNFYKPKMVY